MSGELEQGKYSEDQHYPYNFSVTEKFPGKRTRALQVQENVSDALTGLIGRIS